MTASTIDLATCVIAIPTFRRPQLLRALLNTLLPEVKEKNVLVIVADNDCGTAAPAIAAEFTSRGMASVCVPVAERGLAAVRNALIDNATAVAPQWQWLLMLDDDGLVAPGWLRAITSTGERFDAHLVGGPVEGQLPATAGLLARNSIYARRRRWPTGLVPTLNTTQNLAIGRSVIGLIGEPLFRSEYALSGGEDYDLFRRVAEASGRLAWCDEAIVVEPAPPDRLKTRALLSRYATTGAYMALIDSTFDGAARTWGRAFKGLLGAGLGLGKAALTFDADALARAVLTVAHQLGRIAGMSGLRTARYAQPSGKPLK